MKNHGLKTKRKTGDFLSPKIYSGKKRAAYENGVFVHCCQTQNEFSLFQS